MEYFYAVLQFHIIIQFNGRRHRLQVTRTAAGPALEQYLVAGRNRSITLQCNRPVLRARGLKHKPVQWKLLQGQVNNDQLVQLVGTAIEQYLAANNL